MIKSEFDKGWVVGFIENKGVFTKNKIKIKRKTKTGSKNYFYTNPVFYVVSKDKTALEVIRNQLEAGKITRHGPVFHLEIRKKNEVIRLAEFLEGKFKSEERIKQFTCWKNQVLEWKSRAWGEGARNAEEKSG